jgi:excisionase family DNA binding protein
MQREQLRSDWFTRHAVNPQSEALEKLAVQLAASATSVEPRLFARAQAATYLGVSLEHFKEVIQPQLERVAVRSGRRVLFDRKDLDVWVGEQKGGSSGPSGKPGSSGSRTTDDATNTPRAKEIAAKLRSSPRRSTRRLFPVGESGEK